MKTRWFQTWKRPEYEEWAVPIKEGYLLHIIRKEKDKYFCVQAKLLMGETGLPGFQVVKEQRFATRKEALKQIEKWKN